MTAQRIFAAAATAATLVGLTSQVEAGARHRSHLPSYEAVPIVRDCTPVNGPHGYYGNPWCDGGFLTLEEQEYRTAKRLDIARHGYRYRDGRRRLIEAR